MLVFLESADELTSIFLFFLPVVFSPFPLSSAHIYSDVERVYEADAGAARAETARRKIHSTVYGR